MKLFYFRDDKKNFCEWVNAVHKCAFAVFKIRNPKGKARLPGSRIIYKWMWGGEEDCFQYRHQKMPKSLAFELDTDYKDIQKSLPKGDEENAGKFIRAYHIWLAKRLSTKGRVTLEGVQNEIRILLKKYPYRK